MTNKERLEDLLTEFDELDMQPMIIVPSPVERAKAWKHELEYAIRHLKVEVAREVLAKVDELAWQHKMRGRVSMNLFHDDLEKLKQKYTEESDDGRK